nr:NCK-interacting protein with SH3 domain-like [Penaeus vannamei]
MNKNMWDDSVKYDSCLEEELFFFLLTKGFNQQVVEVVLNSLATALPVLQPLCLHILSSKGDQVDGGADKWQQSSDGRRLVELLEKLRECKDDEQQRSWHCMKMSTPSLLIYPIYLISNNIIYDLKEISSHFSDETNTGDLMVCRSVLSLDDFRPLLTLVQYYQMETRWPLRKLLLQVFGAVCQMSAANISYLSASVFPVELTRELLDSTYDQERLRYTSLVLGWCCVWGILYRILISYHEDPDTEQLAELYLAIVLAFNLQYTTLPPSAVNPPKSCETTEEGEGGVKSQANGDLEENKDATKTAMGADSENIIIKLLSKRENTKVLHREASAVVNREEDPLAMFDHEPRPPHSVLKMMRDMYSTRATASIFYTNDECVLCDIIIRQLSTFLQMIRSLQQISKKKAEHVNSQQ